jgi:glycosyltransferase involved in cell wall biosynthesis
VVRAISSVLNQTYAAFELIVVDDASGDETACVCARFDDPRLHYLRHPVNRGAAAARNTGIRAARGTYVAFMDDDDEYLPHYLESMHAALLGAPGEVGFAWGGTCVVDDRTGQAVPPEPAWQPHFATREQAYLGFLLSRHVGSGCGLAVRRSCLFEAGLFDEALAKAEDTDLLIRLARLADFVVVPDVLVRIHLHDGPRLTQHDRKMADAYARITAKHLDTLQRSSRHWVALHYKTGWLYYHAGEPRLARRYLGRALRRRPWHVKSWAALLLFELLGGRAAGIHRRISQRRMALGVRR